MALPPRQWQAQNDTGEPGVPHERLTLPATAVVDAAEWDAAVSGSAEQVTHLVAGVPPTSAGDWAACTRRRHAVSLSLPVADRAEDETRANLRSRASTMVVDPTGAATDLRKIAPPSKRR